MTALPLEDRLKQHRMNGKNYKKLFLIDSFMDLNEARGYEEVIEELMTDPKHNKEHLFTNENNIVNELYLCVLHPNLIEYTAATKSQNADTKCVYYSLHP